MENEDESIILKAYGGDRAKNLEGIADEVDRIFDEAGASENCRILEEMDIRRIKGYMEQLRIIADEIRLAPSQRVHIDIDDEQWGRVASDATVLELHETTCLLSVDSVRANIIVPISEIRLATFHHRSI